MKQLIGAFIIFIGILPNPGTGQSYFYNENYYEPGWLMEAGIFLGAMNCLTDLGGTYGKGRPFMKDLNLTNSRIATGLFFEALFNHSIGFRLQVTKGSIKAFDSILIREKTLSGSRYRRNLHFHSSITEISLLTELYPLSLLNQVNPSGRFQYFITGGISRFWFNPIAISKGQWVELQPLRTEGQGLSNGIFGEAYPLSQWNIPVGMGIRYELSPHFNLRLETLGRILFTDYLDDVSTNYCNPDLFYRYFSPEKAVLAYSLADKRKNLNNTEAQAGEMRGNPHNNDSYFTLSLSISILLNRKSR